MQIRFDAHVQSTHEGPFDGKISFLDVSINLTREVITFEQVFAETDDGIVQIFSHAKRLNDV